MSSNSDVKTAAALPIPVYIISDTPYGKACLAVYSAYISRGAPTLGTRVRWRQRLAFSHPPTPFGCPSPLRGLEAATSPSREHACEIPSRLLRHLECIPRFTKGESHSRFGDPATLAPPLAALASPKSAGGSSDRQVAPAQASGLEISMELCDVAGGGAQCVLIDEKRRRGAPVTCADAATRIFVLLYDHRVTAPGVARRFFTHPPSP
ncbi:hypothetical protein RhiJN_22578 [Ceratobasidium sp. AG-Ba]|nr:hypothetical protein RhiJN_21001 [Ceratobasidium sp. AG-Ba]QRV94560.1 hypothetical protein RhiJN_22578 [Ceratobasidium sp. AG-Ba]